MSRRRRQQYVRDIGRKTTHQAILAKIVFMLYRCISSVSTASIERERGGGVICSAKNICQNLPQPFSSPLESYPAIVAGSLVRDPVYAVTVGFLQRKSNMLHKVFLPNKKNSKCSRLMRNIVSLVAKAILHLYAASGYVILSAYICPTTIRRYILGGGPSLCS